MLLRLALLFLVLSSVACRSTQRLVKAFPAEPTDFLQHGKELKKTKAADSPFLLDWKNSDKDIWGKAAEKKTIYIAPVSLEKLRPMSRTLSKVEVGEKERQKKVAKLAHDLERELTQAFEKAPEPRRQVVKVPDKTSLVLELAIVELNPNPISGGLMRKGINILLWPGAETMMSHKLKGNMAIEGRLRDAGSKKTLYEFADAEQNRSGIILYYHDYTNFSYFRKAVREWATQIEDVIRKQGKSSIKDGPPATFMLW
ncbi:MAG: DUF3313 family protein [Verrucomicrobia bacterium]|nr:DUF3313 family protein [Verrucomicrobiota bacterium]